MTKSLDERLEIVLVDHLAGLMDTIEESLVSCLDDETEHLDSCADLLAAARVARLLESEPHILRVAKQMQRILTARQIYSVDLRRLNLLTEAWLILKDYADKDEAQRSNLEQY